MNNELNNKDNNHNNEQIPKNRNFSSSPINQKNNYYSNQISRNQEKLNSNKINSNQFNIQKNGYNRTSNGSNKSPAQNYKKFVAKEGLKKLAGPGGSQVVEQLSNTKIGDEILTKAADNSSIRPFRPFKMFGKKNDNNQQDNKQDGEKNSVKGSIEISKQITKFMAIMPGLISGCFVFLIIITVISIIISPLFYMDSLLGKTSSFFEKVGNFVTLRGWCTDEECTEIEKNNFYEEVEKVYNEYKTEKNVELNTSLIIATLTYVDPMVTSDKLEEIDDEDFSIEDFQSSNMIDFKKSKNMVRLLAKNMVTECCFENGKEFECAEYPQKNVTCPADVVDEETDKIIKKYEKKYVVNTDYYTEYLRREFIRKFYYDGNSTIFIDNKIDDIIKEILLRTEFYELLANNQNTNYNFHTYAYCSGVSVVDENGNLMGTYDLEDYVAGVVRHEVASNQGEEAHKALAVVARTYTLAVTKNCTVSIENSTNSQMATIEDVDDYASKAANATSGKVLIYNGQIFASQYDSYCYNDKDCNYGEENGKLYVDYTKLPNGEKHRVYLSKEYEGYINGGHGRGLSQVVAYEMAANGSTYEEIVKFFYSDGVSIVNMSTGYGDYISSSEPPISAAQLKEKSDYYASLGIVMIGSKPFNLSILYNGNASNLGQCVWYARSRALELILMSNMDDDTKIQALNAISNVAANGEGWYDHPSLSMFEKSTDSSMPVPGAIVSWSGGSNVCDPRCGHVAIVESVDYENQTITISEGYNADGADGADTWENVRFQTKTYTFESIKGYSDPSRYSFNGYVYILGKGE